MASKVWIRAAKVKRNTLKKNQEAIKMFPTEVCINWLHILIKMKKKIKKKLTITIKKSKFRTSRKWTWLQLFCFNGSKILSPVLVSCLQPQLCSWRRYGHTMCPRWKELSEWRVLETLCPNKSISFDSDGFFNSKWHPQVMYFVNFWMSWESPCFPLCLL